MWSVYLSSKSTVNKEWRNDVNDAKVELGYIENFNTFRFIEILL